jgi:hypothetical protein
VPQAAYSKLCNVTIFKQSSNRDASSYLKDYLVRYADDFDIKDFIEIVKSIAED